MKAPLQWAEDSLRIFTSHLVRKPGSTSVFGDSVMATAILDRLLHHATTVNIKGESYRLKEKRKAGLLGKPRPRTEPEEVRPNETD